MNSRAAFGLFLCAATSWAQQYVISTVAGGAPLPTPIAATTAPLGGISGVAADSAGNVYFTSSNCVFKLDLFGVLTRIAGNSRAGYSGDGGPATSAQFNSPGGIAVDAAGNLFIGDRGNDRVRRISLTGIVTTVAGGGPGSVYTEGGPAIAAALDFISGIAVDASGNVFISDLGYFVVRKISPTGIITTFAGTSGSYGYSGDGGPAVDARLEDPYGLGVDSSGDVFIADGGNDCVRKVSANGTITTVAGTGFYGFSGDEGLAVDAQLANPQGVALDGSGNLYITDSGNYRIRRVSSNGMITTIAGNGTYGLTDEGGSASGAELTGVADIAVDGSGNIVIDGSALGVAEDFVGVALLGDPLTGSFSFIGSDIGYSIGPGISVLRKISTAGIIETIAGNGASGLYGVGGSAANAQFGSVQGIAIDGSGNLYIADPVDNEVLKISIAGILSTVAGNGTYGFSGDGGVATQAELANPVGISVNASGNIFIADQYNGRIRKVSSSGIITTVAGNGNAGYAGDGGSATNAEIARPAGVAVDGSGDIFILDSVNAVVRKVSPSGVITTIAGNGSAGYSGDGGPAIDATMDYPSGIALDASGDIFIADANNYAIRKVSTTGIVTTVAGGNGYGNSGDGGPATKASIQEPEEVTVDSAGDIFIGDATGRLRIVSPKGVINTIAGNGTNGYSGDGGLATAAETANGYGIAVDGMGDVFLGDSLDRAVRKLTPTSQTVLISSVVDAASERALPVSPGKIVAIYGAGLGPATGVTATPVNGVFGTQLAGTTVTFTGIAAPVYYASATQVNVIVPYEISGGTVNVAVLYQGGISLAFPVAIAATSPGLFSYNATGAGQAAAVNVVDGTLNTAANPVKIGAYVSLYATGEGQTTPFGVDGKLATTTLPSPALPVTATVGGLPAFVQYAGAVHGAVAGLMQVNVQVPAGVTPGGYVPVVLTVGTTSTVNGAVWISVTN